LLKVLDVAQGGQLYAEASPSVKRLIQLNQKFNLIVKVSRCCTRRSTVCWVFPFCKKIDSAESKI